VGLKTQLIDLGTGSNAPGASADVSFNLMGHAHECLYLKLEDAAGVRTEAEIAADVDRVKLYIDGEEQWNIRADDLVRVREYDGESFGDTADDTTGALVIPLVPSFAISQDLAANLRLGTKDLKSCSLLVKCTAACGATKMRLGSDVAPNENCGLVRSIKERPRNHAAADTEEINDLPMDVSRRICRYFINLGATPGVIDVDGGVVYSQNGVPKCEMRPSLASTAAKRAGRTAHASWCVVDLQRRGLLADAVAFAGDPSTGHPDPITEHALKIVWSTAPAAYRILEETYVYIVGQRTKAAAAEAAAA
jgi:hypothetical protein